MTNDGPRTARDLLEQATIEIKRLKALNRKLEGVLTEPIAVVGLACRVPGAADPSAFWRVLADGVDAVQTIPETRWPRGAVPGAPELRFAGIVDDVDAFDAGFFEMSPREARALDPQHRMALEVAYEALECAGLPADRLAGSSTGVYLGIATTDYRERVQDDADSRDRFGLTGNLACTAAGRISYTFGLLGPAVAFDTACSSSLFAVHAASQSLRLRETDLALAGGVNVVLSPVIMGMLGTLDVLSPDGRCKTFDARANGFVRGEGCGFVVLKRLRDALRDGDAIWAVLRGSAANQDGRSAGLTAPNTLSQQALVRQALAAADVKPEHVGYVEAHGTGTPLGDPIELEGLTATLGQPRPSGLRCALGCVKTNIGHLETAAGIAGLLKTVLALKHELIPKHLHFQDLNPRATFAGTPFFVPVEATPWPRGDQPRIAGVSSFGLSGTNCHVVVEEAPAEAARPVEPEAPRVVLISAKTDDALVAQARRWGSWLEAHPDVRVSDVAYTSAHRRTHHARRVALVGRNGAELASRLRAIGEGSLPPGCVRGHAERLPRPVFLFSGHGSQWVGMGRGLHDEPAFAEALRACATAMAPFVEFSLDDVLASADASWLERSDVVQPAIWALQVALAALWESWGVRPAVVVGHSMGEVAAACVAGLLTLDDGARIVCRRSQIVRRVVGLGGMAVVELSEDAARAALRGFEDKLSVAVSNTARSTVIAGERDALDALVRRLGDAGVFCRSVKVDYASHSPLMDPLRDDLLAALADTKGRAGRVAMVSTVTGEPLAFEDITPDYWVRNLRQPVLFARAFERLLGETTAFIEISPHPILAPVVEDAVRDAAPGTLVVGSLRRERDDREVLLEAASRLHVGGVDIDLARLCPAGRLVDLPTYAWQHERFLLPLPAWQVPSSEQRSAAAQQPAVSADSPFLAVEWRRADAAPVSVKPAAGDWLLVCGTDAIAGAIANELAHILEAGGHVERVDPAAPAFGNTEAFEGLLRERFPRGCRGIVHLASLAIADALEVDAAATWLGALRVLQAAARQAWRDPPRISFVTRGAQSVTTESASPASALLWGLARAAWLEHPELGARRIDLDPARPHGEVDALARELVADDDPAEELALRDGARFTGSVARVARPQARSSAARFHADAAYLVTGGLGGLGLSLAEWMVEAGARSIVLVARRGLAAEARPTIARMQAAGAEIRIIAADVTRRDDVAGLVSDVRAGGRPLRGIFHAAAVLDDGMLAHQTPERFERVLGPKVLGARHLHLATLDEPLDHFVLFSSAASLLGSPGQSSYSAGNAYLDALAHLRRARGLPALSVNWGVFSAVGLAAQASRAERLDSRGLMAFAPGDAWRELGNLLDAAVAQIGFVPLDARQWADFYPQIATSARFRALASARGAPRPAPLRATLAQGTPAQIARDVHAFVREQVAHVLRMEPARVHVDVPFKRLGLDSLGTLELRNRLENGLGLRLSATLAYTYPDTRSMAEHLVERIAGAPAATAKPAPVAGVPDAASARLSALSDDELARMVREGLR